MKTRSATSNARRTMLRRGRDMLRTAGRRQIKGSPAVDVMELLTEEERDELGAIHKALERIERGIFGACTSCSSRIDEEILIATPWMAECERCEAGVAEEQLTGNAALPLQ